MRRSSTTSFVDNFWHLTRSDADWKRAGVDLPKGGTEASAIMRQAWRTTRRPSGPQRRGLKVIGNINNDLNFTGVPRTPSTAPSWKAWSANPGRARRGPDGSR
jgi:hypothetical protein